MARHLNMDTLQQNFWKEEYNKEIIMRYRWHQKYGAIVKAKQQAQRERRKKAVDNTLRLPSVKPAPPEVAPQLPAQPPPPAAPLGLARERDLTGVDAAILEMEMRPAPRELRNLLYQGISHEDEGRKRYLQLRLLVNPEDKYTFPVTTNFNYGWQMGKLATSHVAPTPKCRIESFFRKNGAFSLLNPRDVAL